MACSEWMSILVQSGLFCPCRSAAGPQFSGSPSRLTSGGLPRRLADRPAGIRPPALGPQFPAQIMAVAAIDPLVHHATIIEVSSDSYRRKQARWCPILTQILPGGGDFYPHAWGYGYRTR